MSTVILLIHVMIAVALVGVVLLQRSEGGALGIGGGGGGGFMTGRSAGNALTKTTAILAACFFVTSLTLGILASQRTGTPSILPAGSDGLAPLQIPAAPAPAAPEAPPAPAAPQAPQSE
ncbi:MAG: preprotein translocase subunit SecG [Methyloceanibacter sp.]|uniref:preprotein translocase subunit SecG n=1 Tax=Methyloceanibacter sp. TaxID=1965321 RepID=UPI003D6C750A